MKEALRRCGKWLLVVVFLAGFGVFAGDGRTRREIRLFTVFLFVSSYGVNQLGVEKFGIIDDYSVES